jgi:hypothetical protein
LNASRICSTLRSWPALILSASTGTGSSIAGMPVKGAHGANGRQDAIREGFSVRRLTERCKHLEAFTTEIPKLRAV